MYTVAKFLCVETHCRIGFEAKPRTIAELSENTEQSIEEILMPKQRYW